MADRLVTRSLRFWIDESPERCLQLWQACRETRDAYNAMLEVFETELRAEVVKRFEDAQAAWREWNEAPKGTRGEKPKSATFAYDPVWRKRLMDAGKAAAPNLQDQTVRQMYQAEFARDVDAYMQRRLWSHENHGIRRRSDAMVVGLNRAGNLWTIQEADGAALAVFPTWNRSMAGYRDLNATPWRVEAVDHRRKTWTMKYLHDALTSGEVAGCKIVPPKRGAPVGKRRFMLMVTVRTEPEQRIGEYWSVPCVAGVDLGMRQFAVYSCPSKKRLAFFECRDLLRAIDKRRENLTGVSRSNRNQVIGEAIGRRMDNFLRVTAKRIVDQCIRDRVTELRMEDLEGIRNAAGEDRDRRFALGAKFPFYKFRVYLEQAAAKFPSLRVVFVNPCGTSQTCSRCGLRDPESRKEKRFVCTGCGFSSDADVNAANNIATMSKALRTVRGAMSTTVGTDAFGDPSARQHGRGTGGGHDEAD